MGYTLLKLAAKTPSLDEGRLGFTVTGTACLQTLRQLSLPPSSKPAVQLDG